MPNNKGFAKKMSGTANSKTGWVSPVSKPEMGKGGNSNPPFTPQNKSK